MDHYFNYCKRQLIESKGDILIFGLSFENDAHIIDMLLKYADCNSENGRKIYIMYIEDEKSLAKLSKSHTPEKFIKKIVERELTEYYNNLGLKLEEKLNKFNKMIKGVPIYRHKEEDVVGIFWAKN